MKHKKNTTPKRTPTNSVWYASGIPLGIFIAFLMFNDILMAILFGIPIGFLFGMALSSQTK